MKDVTSLRLLAPSLLLLLMTAPAAAHDWRAARAEYAGDLAQARAQIRLDGCALLAAVEGQRLAANQQILATYHRQLMAWPVPPRYAAPARPRR
jgi:hypothetical protein